MTATSRIHRWLALLGAALLTTAAWSQAPLREGYEYRAVRPAQPTEAPAGKVEVVEFFGYWCPHCNDFEPVLSDWARRNAGKVEMQYVPIAFAPAQTNLQKLYYALDALGKEKELRRKVFESIHGDASLKPGADVGELATWAEKQGIDKKKFIDTFNSFAVQAKTSRAMQLARAYGVDGVPMLGMGGKYLLSVDPTSIARADLLLAKVMAEK